MSSSLDHTFSYSGSDCRAFAVKGSDEVELKSLNTVSVSVYESKSPVRRLGHRNVVGFTKSIRTIAGSMILTVVEEHPLQKIIRRFDKDQTFSLDPYKPENNGINLSSLIPAFDLLLLYKSETDRNLYAKSKIIGIEFINESIVTSVNDMVTEISLQFVAQDFSEFAGYGSRGKVRTLVPEATAESLSATSVTTISDTNGISNSQLNTSTNNNILRYLNGTAERLS